MRLFDADPPVARRQVDACRVASPSAPSRSYGYGALTYYTADMVRALPDDGHRYETVHGELLVTPAPGLEHQYVVLELAARLRDYLRIRPVGHVLISPADISWAPDVLVQPDVFVTAVAEARTFDWQQIKTLLLAIEVLSPSTSRYDRFTKRRLYQEYGVPWYWIVDIDGRAGARSPAWRYHRSSGAGCRFRRYCSSPSRATTGTESGSGPCGRRSSRG